MDHFFKSLTVLVSVICRDFSVQSTFSSDSSRYVEVLSISIVLCPRIPTYCLETRVCVAIIPPIFSVLQMI